MELATCKIYGKLYKSNEYNKHNIAETLNIVQWLKKLSSSSKKNKWHSYRNVYDLYHMSLWSSPIDPMSQPDVPWQDHHPLGVDGTQVNVLK